MHWKMSALERARGFRKAWLCAIIRGMRLYRPALALLPLIALAAAPPQPAAPALSPGEIVAQAKAEEWVAIAPTDLLVMELAPPDQGPGQASAKAKPRRVVIQLMPPPFSQGWVGNIRKLAAAHWWDGLSVNRVQDNYVVQWGDADGEDKAKARKLPEGLAVVPQREYEQFFGDVGPFPKAEFYSSPLMTPAPVPLNPPVGLKAAFRNGFAVISEVGGLTGQFWPTHCYATVGVGRNFSPDTGSGAELYTVIGHAPRHLDRNIAVVGRVIEGIEHLSSLPRGTGALGFYETAEERVPIRTVRLGSEVSGLPGYQYLSTESQTFALYADARANRRDAFFIRPAGGADICNIPVPVRRVKASP
jgi:peptidylprolyl isomerase